MANVKKIKLPNNTTVDIIDSRITGIDTTVTSDSSNVVTSGAVATAISNTQSAAENAKSVTYNDLKTAKTGGTLVPGTWYRITDYVATTTDTESRSANHPFDVIVMAESTNTLSEEGYAALHSGDTYFSSSNLSAWKVWYNIDNDTTRFAWADSTNGKGVVYRLIDEFQNDLPFDFKGIQFKRYKIDDIDIKVNQEPLHSLVVDERVQLYLGGYFGLSVTANKFIIDSSDYKWYYAFTYLGSTWAADIADASMGTACHATHNTIKPTTNGKLQSLTNVVFARGAVLAPVITGEYVDAAAAHNCFFAEGSTQLSVFGHAANNRSNSQFRRNIIVGHFRHNTIGSDVQNNELCAPDDFSFNSISDYFDSNSIIVSTTDSGSGQVFGNRFASYFRYNIIVAANFSYNAFNSIFTRNNSQTNYGYNIQANEFGVVYDTNFGGNVQFNVTNGYMKNCTLIDVKNCQFLGNLQYIKCQENSNDTNATFTGVMVKGPINGTSSALVYLTHSTFSSGDSNPTNRAIVVESNSDGEIIASWRNADGNEVGMYATIAETESNSWHNIPADAGGTVTSVAMTVPTGLSVSGSPITSSGTLAVTLASGYTIPQVEGYETPSYDRYSLMEVSGLYDTPTGQPYALPGSDLAEENDPDVIVLADDSEVVHKTGNESIAGNKTFSGAIYVNGGLTTDDDTNYDPGKYEWIYNYNGDSLQEALDAKQATLVSGTNIKTVNNQSLLGSGNIDARDIKIVEYGDEQVWSDIVTAYSTKAVYCRINETPDIYTIPLTYLDTSGVALFMGPVQSGGSIYWATVDDSDRWTQGYFEPQSALVSGTNIKTINNTSLLGSGNLSVGGDTNVIETVKVNGAALTPDANKAVNVTVPTKTYVIETDYEHWDENSYTITTQVFDAIVDDALEGRSVVLRFHIIGSEEGYNEVHDYALTYSSSSNNYWGLQFNELRAGNSGRVLFLSKESGTVQHVLYSYAFEMVGNRVTSIDSYSTNYTYPTAKAVYDSVKNLAPKASPALTGTPTAPTATAGTNTTQIATTAFVQSAIPSVSGKADKVSSATNGDFAGLDSNGNLTDSGKKDSDFVHKTGNETIAGNKSFTGFCTFEGADFGGNIDLIGFTLYNEEATGFDWIQDGEGDSVQDYLDAKQATLVSGTNIKTINNESILGSGNITISGGGTSVWEAGTGTTSVKVVDSLGTAGGNFSTVEGKGSVTGGNYTENTLVYDTADTTSGSYSHAEGRYTIACGSAGSHSEGNRTLASGNVSHAEGNQTVASGMSSHAEGSYSRAVGGSSHAEGQKTLATGNLSHAEGAYSHAYGQYSHAELGNHFFEVSVTGAANATTYSVVSTEVELVDLYNRLGSTIISAILSKSRIGKSGSIPETLTRVTQVNSVAVQNSTITISLDVEKTLSSSAALSSDSTYRLNCTMAYGANSHSEGSISYDEYSHAEGKLSVAVGVASHSEGEYTIAKNESEHAEGHYNLSNKASDTYGNAGNTQHSVGIGTSTARKNAVEVMQNGDVYVYGVGGYDGTNYSSASTLQSAVSGGGGSTTDCVHKTGDETVGGDKTFTDDIIVGDASNIKYGASSGGGFTRGYATTGGDTGILTFHNLLGEPKAFIVSPVNSITDVSGTTMVAIVGDSTGCHAIYTSGTQHNYSDAVTATYSNGELNVGFTGGSPLFGDFNWNLVYYYGDGTLTFKTSQVQPGSGATTATFTGTGLTEVPAFYACMLESQVNNESYRRVAYYTNEGGGSSATPMGVSFYSSQIHNTTSNFTASYSNGLLINSGGVNAGGYFHNPGTYTLYYLMASDIGGGGGSYQSLAAELSAITTDISALETGKQDTLVSGTSIKTINSTSLLGSGNIAISSLPTVTTTNNGQLLEVSNGAWATGRKITISSSEPTSATGNNGDIWIVI